MLNDWSDRPAARRRTSIVSVEAAVVALAGLVLVALGAGVLEWVRG